MKLFYTWKKAKKDYVAQKISIEEFIYYMQYEPIWYSTLFGEDINGNSQRYTLSAPDSDKKFYPAFRSRITCTRFFGAAGRRDFTVIEGRLGDFLRLINTDEAFKDLFAVIDPDLPTEMEFPPDIFKNEH